MRLRRIPDFLASRIGTAVLLLGGVVSWSGRAPAQATVASPGELSAEATPIGALPPVALPMPASRDQSYWGLRLQSGLRKQPGANDLFAIAAGVDYQVSGGSIFGITGGYQRPQRCQSTLADCSGHSLYGVRARFNLVTGGPTIAALWGDRNATSTLGTELGVGYAPNVRPGVNACTLDVGLPLSIAMLERIRLVSFVTPGVVWDKDCSGGNTPGFRTFLMGFGLGLQQLGFRGLDVHVGAQRMMRNSTGLQFGVTVSWVRLP
jgi:hypothetical protein